STSMSLDTASCIPGEVENSAQSSPTPSAARRGVRVKYFAITSNSPRDMVWRFVEGHAAHTCIDTATALSTGAQRTAPLLQWPARGHRPRGPPAVTKHKT